MSVTQKVILIALLVVGGLCVIVGFALMHHIGGFLRTVEEEARKSEEEYENPPSEGKTDDKTDTGANL